MELLNLGQLPGEVGVRSEQATVHSAPSPWTFLFEMNETVNLLPVELKLLGPFFWQNLGNVLVLRGEMWKSYTELVLNFIP